MLKSRLHVNLAFNDAVTPEDAEEECETFHRQLMESLMALRDGFHSGYVLTNEKKRIHLQAAMDVILDALQDGARNRSDLVPG